MTICFDDLNCELICNENGGTVRLQDRKEHFDKTCQGDFGVKELCFVVKMNRESQRIEEFTGGCYRNDYYKYDFEKNIDKIQVIVREQEDTFLTALSHSSNYSPYFPSST